MDNKVKYDVVISCAEEDLPVAESIASAFRDKKISYYLYTEHRAQHWGENIFKVSLDKYALEGAYALMIISQHYVTKKWSGIERQIMQSAINRGPSYILPLRLDNTPVDGLGSDITYVNWENNPQVVAALVKDKLLLTEVNKEPPAVKASLANNHYHADNIIVNNGNVETQHFNFK